MTRVREPQAGDANAPEAVALGAQVNWIDWRTTAPAIVIHP